MVINTIQQGLFSVCMSLKWRYVGDFMLECDKAGTLYSIRMGCLL